LTADNITRVQKHFLSISLDVTKRFCAWVVTLHHTIMTGAIAACNAAVDLRVRISQSCIYAAD